MRNALVLAAVEEAPETHYLLNMIRDALGVVNFNKFNPDDAASSSYQVIEQYDVSKYEEKPFEIDLDEK